MIYLLIFVENRISMKTKFFILCLIFPLVFSAQNLPKLSSGKIERIENFKSDYVQPRNVDVWLPDGYSADKKYSVVYMHDGQMLFDSTQTWNHKEWKVDEIVGSLIKNKEIKECIIVGIWNTGVDRISEYMPTKFCNLLQDSQANTFSSKYCNNKGVQGDAYLKFIVKELKPYIDEHYSTFTEKENTVIMGSSMGSLISLYAICEYPETFGSAVCMSTAWLNFIDYRMPLGTFNYLNENLPSSGNHQIYMDYGTGESDSSYVTTQNFVDIIFKSNGYTDKNYQSKVYKNAIHDEIAWSKRLDITFKFVLKKK